MIFVHHLENGKNLLIERPAGVEAFLPISSLMSLRLWFEQGTFNYIHPAGLIVLLSIVLVSLVQKKSFCGWVCPVGLLSEFLFWLHQQIYKGLAFISHKIFKTPYRRGIMQFANKKSIILPKFLDYPLRSLKYLLLLFFLYAVFWQMTIFDIEYFIYSPYNRVADIKMLKFFTEINEFNFKVLIWLMISSLLIPFFWCRYLCPYGALLGSVSVLSPYKIRRVDSTCTQCRHCSFICPARINIHKVPSVNSDECLACLKCVEICPEPNTLFFSLNNARPRPENVSAKTLVQIPVNFNQTDRQFNLTSYEKKKNKENIKEKKSIFHVLQPLKIMRRFSFIVLLLIVFFTPIFFAKIFGFWQNRIFPEEYRLHIKNLNNPIYHHNRGNPADYDPFILKKYNFYFDDNLKLWEQLK